MLYKQIEHSEELKDEWRDKQKQIKAQAVELTYNYWDGSGKGVCKYSSLGREG